MDYKAIYTVLDGITDQLAGLCGYKAKQVDNTCPADTADADTCLQQLAFIAMWADTLGYTLEREREKEQEQEQARQARQARKERK